MAPISAVKVPSQTRWLAIRNSSASITRITVARSGTVMPHSRSTEVT